MAKHIIACTSYSHDLLNDSAKSDNSNPPMSSNELSSLFVRGDNPLLI